MSVRVCNANQHPAPTNSGSGRDPRIGTVDDGTASLEAIAPPVADSTNDTTPTATTLPPSIAPISGTPEDLAQKLIESLLEADADDVIAALTFQYWHKGRYETRWKSPFRFLARKYGLSPAQAWGIVDGLGASAEFLAFTVAANKLAHGDVQGSTKDAHVFAFSAVGAKVGGAAAATACAASVGCAVAFTVGGALVGSILGEASFPTVWARGATGHSVTTFLECTRCTLTRSERRTTMPAF